MNILEIGGGIGSATKKVINDVDASSASSIFSGHEDYIHSKVFDIEKDIVAQGFQEQAYNLVVASFVLHVASSLKRSLHSIRRLVKPGGYLAMLEMTNLEQSRLGYIFSSLPGWWLGADEDRALSPCVNCVERDQLLRETGFSGIDMTTPDKDVLPVPVSTILSQAIDPRVQFLRYPLSSGVGLLDSITRIPVMGGVSGAIDVVDHLEDLVAVGIHPVAVMLNLADLDEPGFKGLTATSLAAVKLLYQSSKYILCVLKGSRAGMPATLRASPSVVPWQSKCLMPSPNL
ncbi:hypothetical protein BBP40_006683 [Aspergillus hancockii]|nr:hypothetical protein BBP40_006683 [Aspergillus hancockii]